MVSKLILNLIFIAVNVNVGYDFWKFYFSNIRLTKRKIFDFRKKLRIFSVKCWSITMELVNKEMQYIPINAAASYQGETGLIYITFIYISLRINDMGAFWYGFIKL